MNKLDSYLIGSYVRKLRVMNDITRSAMAAMLDIHINTYSKIESGNFKKLDLKLVNDISDILQVPAGQILTPPDTENSTINKNNSHKTSIHNLIGGLNIARLESLNLVQGDIVLSKEIEAITPLITDLVRATIVHSILLKMKKTEQN